MSLDPMILTIVDNIMYDVPFPKLGIIATPDEATHVRNMVRTFFAQCLSRSVVSISMDISSPMVAGSPHIPTAQLSLYLMNYYAYKGDTEIPTAKDAEFATTSLAQQDTATQQEPINRFSGIEIND